MRGPLICFLLFVVGCGGKSSSDQAHFTKKVVPTLEADLAALFPSMGAITWTDKADRTEQDGLMPVPRTVGHSYIVIGQLAGSEVVMEGKYERKNPTLVFTTIRLTAKGHWSESGFPVNALTDLKCDPATIALFSPIKYENNAVYVEDMGKQYEVQPMATSFETDASGKRTGEVTEFEFLVMEAKKR